MKKTLLLIVTIFVLFSGVILGQSIPHDLSEQKLAHGKAWENESFNPAQQTKSLIPLYDSIYQWISSDFAQFGWSDNPTYRTISITYNANNKMTGKVKQQMGWDGTGLSWQNKDKYTYTYNLNGNLTIELTKQWISNQWVNNDKYTYTYDANNNMTSELTEGYWSSEWHNVGLNTYSYDVNNLLTTQLIQYPNSDTTFGNNDLYTYTYDANNNNISYTNQFWNGSGWDNLRQTFNTFDEDDNKTSSLFQEWNGSSWDNTRQNLYTYDANNNQISNSGQNWTGSAWEDTQITTYTYDANNFQKSYVWKNWGNSGNGTIYADSTIYYFHTVTGINEADAPALLMQVYPNPVSSNLTLETTLTESGNVHTELKNAIGQVVSIYNEKVNSGLYKKTIDINTLAKGIYYLTLQTDEGIATKKIALVK